MAMKCQPIFVRLSTRWTITASAANVKRLKGMPAMVPSPRYDQRSESARPAEMSIEKCNNSVSTIDRTMMSVTSVVRNALSLR
jgi:hypothetical protein